MQLNPTSLAGSVMRSSYRIVEETALIFDRIILLSRVAFNVAHPVKQSFRHLGTTPHSLNRRLPQALPGESQSSYLPAAAPG